MVKKSAVNSGLHMELGEPWTTTWLYDESHMICYGATNAIIVYLFENTVTSSSLLGSFVIQFLKGRVRLYKLEASPSQADRFPPVECQSSTNVEQFRFTIQSIAVPKREFYQQAEYVTVIYNTQLQLIRVRGIQCI